MKKSVSDSQTAEKPRPGDPFPCPNCGADDWRVSYPESAHQDVIVIVGEDGKPEIEDYTGNTDTYSDGDGDNEELRCNECDHVITWGSHIFMTTEEEARLAKIERTLTDLKSAQNAATQAGLGMDMNVIWGCIGELVELARPA